jgi:[acyl-carrier-protein] S-malonyltransferase
MKEAGGLRPGGMAAVLGADIDVVEEACRRASETSGAPVEVANDNCPGQVVISGAEAGLEAATPVLQALGARRVIRLAVSIAAHSSLMAPAQKTFRLALASAHIDAPRVVVVGNVGAGPLETAADVRADLEAQLTSRVRWTESVRRMAASGVTRFFEIGTGEVLSGLIRRIDPGLQVFALDLPAGYVSLGT